MLACPIPHRPRDVGVPEDTPDLAQIEGAHLLANAARPFLSNCGFDDDQVRQVLSIQTSPETVEQVMGNRELLDLARRPVMVELILDATEIGRSLLTGDLEALQKAVRRMPRRLVRPC